VLRALAAIAATIRSEHPEVDSVRLFGSIARGDHSGLSDADILIVLRGEAPPDPLESSRTFYRYFSLPLPVDVLVCSETQARHRLDSGDPHFTRMWRESLEL
jgi:predicted nucleotidyltransferase